MFSKQSLRPASDLWELIFFFFTSVQIPGGGSKALFAFSVPVSGQEGGECEDKKIFLIIHHRTQGTIIRMTTWVMPPPSGELTLA